jgi:hypothetical protein
MAAAIGEEGDAGRAEQLDFTNDPITTPMFPRPAGPAPNLVATDNEWIAVLERLDGGIE